MTKNQKIFLITIICFALFFRFFRIFSLPGGLFPDEAANGLDILEMEKGHLQPFYERGNGREALFFYLLWASVRLFGVGVWQHHIVSASIGVLSVLFAFLFTRQLFSVFAKTKIEKNRAINLGLTSAFLMATNSWHIVMSRTAFRAILTPLVTSLSLYFLLKSFNAKDYKNKLIFSALFGGAFAIGFYTYISYRVMLAIVPFIVLAPLFFSFLFNRRITIKKYIRPYLAPLNLAIVSFILVISPLAHYFYTHTDALVGRSGQVSIFNPELNGGNLTGTIIAVTRDSLVGFFINGDLNWRHNISGLPFLSMLISPFFALGMILVLYKSFAYLRHPIVKNEYWTHLVLLAWFTAMLLPVVLTAEGIPHGLRSIGVIPSVFIITSLGLDFLYRKTITWHSNKIAVPIIAGLLFIGLPLESYANYFIIAANSPENYYSFRSDLTEVSSYLVKFGDRNHTYLVLDKFSIQTVDYLTTQNLKDPDNSINRRYIQVDPENVWNIKSESNIRPGDKLVFTESSIFDINKFKIYNPNSRLILEQRNKFGQAILAVYEFN